MSLDVSKNAKNQMQVDFNKCYKVSHILTQI